MTPSLVDVVNSASVFVVYSSSWLKYITILKVHTEDSDKGILALMLG